MERCRCPRMRKKIKIRETKFWNKAMKNGWTPQRKAKQAVAIQRWKPWQRATGPKSPEGKAVVSKNAFKGSKRLLLRQSIAVLRKYFRDNEAFLKEL